MGGNLVTYNFHVGTPTFCLENFKLHCNSVISKPNTWYIFVDVKNSFNIPLEEYESIKIHQIVFPEKFMQKYYLQIKIDDGYAYAEV